jgi:hypothetical protein
MTWFVLLGHRKRLTAISVDALQPGSKYRPAPPPYGPAFGSRPCCPQGRLYEFESIAVMEHALAHLAVRLP